ncbi:uncharacterized protein LOC134664494 [Cydia fagiglandana]|uniref:uncharacterized protein LOC134664494 n=1 Tax=Cydia fagiglandana TaxID=1458189 RepID=UPI002FEE0193
MSRAAETTKAQMETIKNKNEVARVEVGAGQRRTMKKEHSSDKRQPSRSRTRDQSYSRQQGQAYNRDQSYSRQQGQAYTRDQSCGRQQNQTNTRRSCGKCGRQHGYAKCPAFNKKCVKCGKYNHFAAMCLNKMCGSV